MKISTAALALISVLSQPRNGRSEDFLRGGDSALALVSDVEGHDSSFAAIQSDEPVVSSVLSAADLAGINDFSGYEAVAKKFVGLNKKFGEGSGFVIKDSDPPGAGAGDIKGTTFPVEKNPDSNTGRNDLCTCDCVAGPDGVGCVGWGGIKFRYSSMLSIDPNDDRPLDHKNRVWSGQLQAFQKVVKDETYELNFIGTDTRYGVGGPAIYSVACTDNMCDGLISGTFRQSNDRVSCEAGLDDKAAGLADQAASGSGETSCFVRCANSETYTEWLNYCDSDEEDTTSGFSGYGI